MGGFDRSGNLETDVGAIATKCAPPFAQLLGEQRSDRTMRFSNSLSSTITIAGGLLAALIAAQPAPATAEVSYPWYLHGETPHCITQVVRNARRARITAASATSIPYRSRTGRDHFANSVDAPDNPPTDENGRRVRR
jgi:hypothetical protein